MLLRKVLFNLIIERVVRNCGDVIHVDHRFVFALPVVFVFCCNHAFDDGVALCIAHL